MTEGRGLTPERDHGGLPMTVGPRRLVYYDVPLTHDPVLLIRLTLPRDLTQEEADRLCGIIQTLPMIAPARRTDV